MNYPEMIELLTSSVATGCTTAALTHVAKAADVEHGPSWPEGAPGIVKQEEVLKSDSKSDDARVALGVRLDGTQGVVIQGGYDGSDYRWYAALWSDGTTWYHE